MTLMRAAILGLAAGPVIAGFIQPAMAQSQQSLIIQARQTVADYKRLCKKIDDTNTKLKEIENNIEVSDIQLDVAYKRSKQLDERVSRIGELSILRGTQELLGEEAPLLNQIDKQHKRLKESSNRVDAFINEWEIYSTKLTEMSFNLKGENNQAQGEKDKLKKQASILLELLKDLPKNPDIIADDPEKKKLIEDADKLIKDGINRLYPSVGLIVQRMQELEGPETTEDRFLDSEEYNQLLQEFNVNAAKEFAKHLTKNLAQLTRDAEEFEADLEKIRTQQLSKGQRKRVDIARPLPEPLAPILLDEPTGDLDDPVIGPLQNIIPYLTISGGINALFDDKLDLPAFNQFLNTDRGSYLAVEVGVEKRITDNVHFLGSLTFSRLGLGLNSLGNNPPFTGLLPLGGDIETYSIAPQIGVSWDIFKDEKVFVQPWVKVGGGVAFQNLTATNGGINVLSESETTAMATFSAGLDFPINDIASIGVGGYVNWFDGFNVTAGPGVTSLLEDRTEMGAFMSLKFAIREGGRTIGHGR